jgi:hypothetical protein
LGVKGDKGIRGHFPSPLIPLEGEPGNKPGKAQDKKFKYF